MPHFRQNTRLPHGDYLGRRTYFVTICCDQRSPYLRSPGVAQCVLQLVQQTAAKYSFLLHAFCVMPDHLHVLAQGIEPHSDLSEFIRIFKQHTSFAFQKTCRHRLWEKSYYDYVLRPSDSIEGVACYIWWNPVRKQLCVIPQEFPFTGSQTIDWMKHSAQGRFYLNRPMENPRTSLKAGHYKLTSVVADL